MSKKKLALAAAILMMLLAIGITVYPIISTAYNDAHQSEIMTQHKQDVEKVPDEKIMEMQENAKTYNQMLNPISAENYTAEMLKGASENYEDQLDLVGDGIMGYVEIPKIHVYLPIYHGTNNATLEIGVGHLLGSSLPIGGKGTHTVLTAHSGMASNKMFSDLPQLREGDYFYLHVLNQILAYQVDSIHTVLPHDVTYLGLDSNQDLCTLVTCTPFGVNTHRLLVRGTRIPYTPSAYKEIPTEDSEKIVTSNWEQEYIKGILYGIVIVVVILVLYSCYHAWRKHHEKT